MQNFYDTCISFFQDVGSKFYDAFIFKNRYQYILDGLSNTLLITLAAVIIGVLIGTIVALIKVSYSNSNRNVGLKFLNIIANLYLTVIRGTPVVVQLMIMYYIIMSSDVDKITTSILAFGINSGAYVAEVIRSGIQSVDKGQVEAGRSLGLNQSTTMIKIVFPQALKNVLPAIGNEFIALLKETSVAGFIGVQDLTKGGDILRSITYDRYTPILSIAAIYLILVILLTSCLSSFERRLRKGDKR